MHFRFTGGEDPLPSNGMDACDAAFKERNAGSLRLFQKVYSEFLSRYNRDGFSRGDGHIVAVAEIYGNSIDVLAWQSVGEN